MSTATLSATLKTSDFFKDFPEDHLEELLALAKEVEFQPQTDIFCEHEPAKDVYLIAEGRVSLVICAEKVGCRQIMEVSDGDLIGWSALLEKPRLSDTAHTLTPVKVVALDGAKLIQLCQENPKFGFEFMRRTANVLCERLYATRWRLLDVHGFHLPEVVVESD